MNTHSLLGKKKKRDIPLWDNGWQTLLENIQIVSILVLRAKKQNGGYYIDIYITFEN